MIKTILFDLDGTLLPMDQDVFIKAYMKAIASKLIPHGFKPEDTISCIWRGVGAMVKNDGSKTNEEVFWLAFANSIGDWILENKSLFDEFYQKDFPKLSNTCGYTDKAGQLITKLKADNYKLILATNPIFPTVATQWRIKWAGINANDFDLITAYEGCHFSKPNPMYYEEILDKIGCKAEECLMVGNDVIEDMVASKLGMKVFLLTDCLINKDNKDISAYPHGSFEELDTYISNLL